MIEDGIRILHLLNFLLLKGVFWALRGSGSARAGFRVETRRRTGPCKERSSRIVYYRTHITSVLIAITMNIYHVESSTNDSKFLHNKFANDRLVKHKKHH